MKFRREWAMPDSDTFDIPPIGALIRHYLTKSTQSIDPFARNKRWATLTNDLDPSTLAQYHMDALEFLKTMKSNGITVDLALFDPPYSPRQIKECYESIGMEMTTEDAWRTHAWTAEKDAINSMLLSRGTVICCDWNSVGMGSLREYSLIEVLLVCHGAGHNDTIVTVWRKNPRIEEFA